MKLTSENVNSVFDDCLFTDDEIKAAPNGQPAKMVAAEGIVNKFGFHPERIERHSDDVRTMLSDLPDSFMHDKGGGMSFLNACMTKNDEHWAEHPTMEKIFALGIGLNLVKPLMPRPMWRMMPGGMPYYVVNLEGFPNEQPVQDQPA